MNPPSDDSHFATTRWTGILKAKGDSNEAKEALRDLCETYYAPVHEFIRHQSRDLPEDDARDLTHAFFASLLKNPGFGELEKGRSRFRSYLLGAVKHFLSDQRKFNRAEKRGGGKVDTSIEDVAVSVADVHDVRFDREWAVNLIELAIDQLAKEHEKSGKLEAFEALKPWLNGNTTPVTQVEAASQLSMTEGAVKVAIHRLRKRFRELVTEQIRETVETEGEVSGELNYLIEVLQAG